MPTPARTSTEHIIAAGRRVLETEGLDGLTMQHVADAVGVRAPSLYKHVDGRWELIRLIAVDVARDLADTLDTTERPGDPQQDLVVLARAFRDFARRHPEAYALLFRRLPEGVRSGIDLATPGFGTLFRTVEAVAGPERRLEAARTLVAWASGFVAMELAGAFRMGGDVEAAFEFGAQRVAAAIAEPEAVR